MIQTVKISERARKEYRILPAVIMDALDEGEARGLERGKSLGIAEGSRQKALETAKVLKQLGDSMQKIMQFTGLSKEEVEAIGNLICNAFAPALYCPTALLFDTVAPDGLSH